YNINPNKISVTHLGVKQDNKDTQNLDNKEIIENKNEYLLYIGTIEPRKNIEGIIQSFEDFCLENNINNLDLVIAGKDGWNNKYIYKILEKSKVKDHIKILNYVTEKEKIELYRKAKMFLFPSFYEGFGIPIIEAQSFGVPIITSNNSSLSEIVKNSAICINPYNINEIKEAIKNLYFDNNLYKYYQKLSLENSKQFTWLKTAENTLKIFEQIKKDMST
ncbi:MAG: glycosyltransferase family 1 protein, partial [Patescibacteria group bacterium]